MDTNTTTAPTIEDIAYSGRTAQERRTLAVLFASHADLAPAPATRTTIWLTCSVFPEDRPAFTHKFAHTSEILACAFLDDAAFEWEVEQDDERAIALGANPHQLVENSGWVSPDHNTQLAMWIERIEVVA